MDNGIIHRLFLKEYESSSFIIQQKATVLTWSHLILIPVVTSYFFINLMRNNARELMGVFFIDLSFLAALTIGLVLIRKGKYQTDVNSIIIITTILTILGHLVKRHVQVETGANSYCVLHVCSHDLYGHVQHTKDTYTGIDYLPLRSRSQCMPLQ